MFDTNLNSTNYLIKIILIMKNTIFAPI